VPRQVAADDLQVLAAVLARAFEQDAATRWLLPDDESYMGRATRFYELALREDLPRGGCWTTDDRQAVALWEPPGDWGFAQERLPEVLPELQDIYQDDFQRVAESFATMVERHPQDPHWYLWIIGVDPARQGRGHGAQLLDAMLERVDAEGMPAYLEASTPRNARLYERHGFETTEIWSFPGGGPEIAGMWREPR